MKKWNPNASDKFTPEQRELIKETLFSIFAKNKAAIVVMKNGQLKPYDIWKYTLKMAGMK